MLASPTGRRAFKKFLRKIVCEENLEFWEECQKLKKLPSDDHPDVKENCERILNLFIVEKGGRSLNLEHRNRENAIERAPNWSRNMFDAALNEVMKLMRTDSYPKFVASDAFEKAQEAGIQNGDREEEESPPKMSKPALEAHPDKDGGSPYVGKRRLSWRM